MKNQAIFTAIEQSFGSIREFHEFEQNNKFEMEISHTTMCCEPYTQLIFWFGHDNYIEHIQSENHTKWLNTNHPDWFKDLCLNILKAKRNILARVSE